MRTIFKRGFCAFLCTMVAIFACACAKSSTMESSNLTMSNLINQGHFALGENHTFYLAKQDGIYAYDADTDTERNMVCSYLSVDPSYQFGIAGDLQLYDGKLFFTLNYALYAVDLENASCEKLVDHALSPRVYDGVLYYYKESGSLYTYDLGSRKTSLLSEDIHCFQIYQDSIYYTKDSSIDSSIYKSDLAMRESTKITPTFGISHEYLLVAEDHIFLGYRTSALYCITDNQVHRITDDNSYAAFISLDDENLYYEAPNFIDQQVEVHAWNLSSHEDTIIATLPVSAFNGYSMQTYLYRGENALYHYSEGELFKKIPLY